MTTVQLGAALSQPLFDRIGAAGTVALRLALAALILWPFARPRLRGRSRADLGAAVALGACSGGLTLAFFESISRIPLGVAVTFQFLGPLGVALAGSRRPLDVGWVLAAGDRCAARVPDPRPGAEDDGDRRDRDGLDRQRGGDARLTRAAGERGGACARRPFVVAPPGIEPGTFGLEVGPGGPVWQGRAEVRPPSATRLESVPLSRGHGSGTIARPGHVQLQASGRDRSDRASRTTPGTGFGSGSGRPARHRRAPRPCPSAPRSRRAYAM